MNKVKIDLMELGDGSSWMSELNLMTIHPVVIIIWYFSAESKWCTNITLLPASSMACLPCPHLDPVSSVQLLPCRCVCPQSIKMSLLCQFGPRLCVWGVFLVVWRAFRWFVGQPEWLHHTLFVLEQHHQNNHPAGRIMKLHTVSRNAFLSRAGREETFW